MSRRRRGFFGRLTEMLRHAGNEVLSWLLWPFFLVRDAVTSIVGGRRSAINRRTWGEFFIEYLLLIPRWIGMGLVWLYHSMLKWPRVMRLRDLASGLPALLAACAAVVILFFLSKEQTDLIQAYERDSNEAYLASQDESDEAARKEKLKLAQFYSRALVKLKPDDLKYKYYVGYMYQELGEPARAQAIMDSLAPRYANGFPQAHIWQADQLLDGPLDPDSLDAVQAHLERALATTDEPEEVHRRLGELFYFRYVRYNQRTVDFAMTSRDMYLQLAEEHFSKITKTTPKLSLTLAEVRSLLGKNREAERDVRLVISDLAQRVTNVPDDIDSRIMLAQSHRMVHEFDKAAEILQTGMRLTPDRRYKEELARVYFFFSRYIRQTVPNSWTRQFQELQKAYLANFTDGYVTHRFVEALSSSQEEEAEAARKTLQNLVDAKAPGQMATFLLGFDLRRRTVPVKAEEYFRSIRAMPSEGTPEVIAGLSGAVLMQQVKSIHPSVGQQLFESSLLVWPNHPDLLRVRAQQNLMLRNFPAALGDLKKALEQRPQDAKLHEMLASTYERLGQRELANRHREQADVVRHSAAPFPLSKD